MINEYPLKTLSSEQMKKRYEVRSFKVSKMNIKPCLGWVAWGYEEIIIT